MPGLEIKTNYLKPEEVAKVDINSLTEKNKTWVKEQLTDLAKSIDPKLDVKKDTLNALDNLGNEILIKALSKFKNADGTYKSFSQLEKGTSPKYAFLLQSALKKVGAYNGKLDGIRGKSSQAALNTFGIMDAKGNYVSNLPVAGLISVLEGKIQAPIKVQEKPTTPGNKPTQTTEKPTTKPNTEKLPGRLNDSIQHWKAESVVQYMKSKYPNQYKHLQDAISNEKLIWEWGRKEVNSFLTKEKFDPIISTYALYKAMEGVGTDKDLLNLVMKNSNTSEDFSKLVSRFGTPEGQNLYQWLVSELSSPEYRSLLKNNFKNISASDKKALIDEGIKNEYFYAYDKKSASTILLKTQKEVAKELRNE